MTDTHHAQLHWDEQGQPLSSQFDDVYFSKASGLAESQHVFLKHNQLPARFANLTDGQTFVIGETGFGTGLNFLSAWQCFNQHAHANARLHFISVEKYPLQHSDLRQALELWPELSELREQLVQQYRAIHEGFQHIQLDSGRISLTLLIGDALEMLQQVDGEIDAWFLDGFAPSKNPEMWNEQVFAQLARPAKSDTTLATFTSAGFVRRGLIAAGFAMQRVPGFGHKREMLAGHFQSTETSSTQSNPWFARPKPHALAAEQRHAIVIGAGLAGCASAASLAARGWRVTMIEQHSKIAQEASGHAQGILYLKLSAHHTALSRFILSGFGYTRRLLESLSAQATTAASVKNWDMCGILQLAFNEKEHKRFATLAEHFPKELLQAVSAEQASAIAGVKLEYSGLFYPEAGWVNPPALCHILSQHPLISLKTTEQALTLSQDAQQEWQVHSANNLIAAAPVVVLCNAANVAQFTQSAHLPLNPVRGQTTQLPATPASEKINSVVCADGYISPARQGTHTIGASFNFAADSQAASLAEHYSNLDLLHEISPSLKEHCATDALDVSTLQGHAAFRCTSIDYLPLVGPVAQHDAFMQTYADLRKDARLPLQHPCPWQQGLYVNTAHGSRGLISAPLAAELLSAWICHEPFPLPLDIVQHSHPNRFALRTLMRHRPQ
ncbi:MAG: bifunctional tRNA (5-methylaminomethyl-2-thiouridine)(34)-methyltransferase MnmD/FAD-dependent 5-carboxymethylaminomethyl-2-thiouridine(34) oxidoreductase MnmC [Gammaproteobacteria bacterium]|nr:bifunctional tRNA (5-methylaminomethyl-2-thiouridine)(34)-methyltransferase MnmD/FAD-dependent 5-carboxymethylaminomethyl-2-thiouridine(34) oxidoreductase MnmC [Gammaproteobacteria bacterium]